MLSDNRLERPKLLHMFSTFGVGGQQARTARLIRCLDETIEHVVLAADGCLDAIDAFGLGGRVRAISTTFVKGRGIAWRNLALVRDLLRREQPDALLTYNFGAIEAALAHRLWPSCRHLHFEDGFGPDELPGRQLTRRVWLRRVALSGNTRIVVPSRTLERIARQSWRFAPDKVEYLPNGVDLARFTSAAQASPRVGGLRVGVVSTLRPEKNLARLLQAVALLPETLVSDLVVAGEGPERPMLTALAQRLGIAGRVTSSAMSRGRRSSSGGSTCSCSARTRSRCR